MVEKLWKINSPPKTRLFLWCVLENKVPTWDILQKRNLQGPGWCILCQADGESNLHMFLQCAYVKFVWDECSKILRVPCVWEGPSIFHALSNWKVGNNLEMMEALPLLVFWGVWLERNNLLFNGKSCTPAITTSCSCGFHNSFPLHIKETKWRVALEVNLDRSKP